MTADKEKKRLIKEAIMMAGLCNNFYYLNFTKNKKNLIKYWKSINS